VGLRRITSSATRGVAGLFMALLCVLALGTASLTHPGVANAATCSSAAVTVTPMHSPDGSMRVFYADIGTTKRSGYVGYEVSGASLGADVWVRLSGFTNTNTLGLAANQSAAVPVRATTQAGKPLVYLYLTAKAETTTAQTFTVEVWNGKPDQTGSAVVCTAADGFTKVLDVTHAAANKITGMTVSNASPALGGSFSVSADGETGTMGDGDAADQIITGAHTAEGVFSMAPAMEDAWPADAFTLTGVQLVMSGTTTRDKLRIYPTTTSNQAYTATYYFTVRKTTAGATDVLPVQNIASGTQVKYTDSYSGAIAQIAAPAITTTLVKTAQSLVASHVTYQVVVSNSSTGTVTLDSLKDTPTPSSGWSFDSGSAKIGGSPTADPVTDSGSLIFNGPFTVPAHVGATDGTLVFTYKLALTATVTNAAVGRIGDVDLGSSSGSTNQVAVDPTAPIVTTGSLPDGTVGSAYSQTVAASAGTTPYSWSVTAGSLPAGLSIGAATGTISGTPTAAATSTFTVTVRDSAAKTASQALSIVVAAAAGGGGGGGGDTTAPAGSVTIDSGAAATNSTAATLALTATDAVGVAAYRVANGSDCAATAWVAVTATTALSTTAALTLPTGDGAKTVCAQFKDAAGNVSSTSTASIALDTARPSVALATTAANPTNGAFTVTATFSESVTGLALGGVNVGNGSVSSLAGSGTTYTFAVTPGGSGTTTVDLAANGATDSAGNANTAAPQLSRTIDATRPSVALSSAAAGTVGGAFTVTATFSEAVTGLALGGISVGNGSASSLAGSGSTYTFSVTPAASGAVTVDLAANAANDTAGNGSTAATRLTRTAAVDPPTVTLASAAADPVSGAFTVSATFSEGVSGLALGSVAVGNGTAAALAGSGTTYSFTVTPAADGAVTVDLTAGAAVTAAGIASLAATQLTRTADSARPALTLTSASPDPTNQAFAVTATFSEPVTGFAAGDVAVANGTVSAFTGSGAGYSFTVTPASNGRVEVDAAAGAAADAAGNTSTAAAQLARAYDHAAPVVTFTAQPDPTTSSTGASFIFAAGETVSFQCSLDGAVFAACASPVSVAGLDAGSHKLVVRATDGAANVSQTTYAWTSAAPVIAFSIRPEDPSEENVSFAWSSTGSGVSFTCKLDARAAAPCGSTASYSDLADGPHTFTVTATGGLTGSAAFGWTVQRRQAARPASVVIIPTINPTDLLGRPQGFRQSSDGAHSAGPFTRTLRVKLHIPTPKEGADEVLISNYADFREQSLYAVAADELYDWTLLAGPSGDRKVYIRFDDAPDAPVGDATIVLDQELPELKPAYLRSGKRIAVAARKQTQSAAKYCGSRGRRWIDLRGADGFSGLNAVQVASDPNHPCAWRPFLPTLSYRLPGAVVYLRIEDRVGNISRWYRLKTPR
jgi:hypothetical protein